MQAFHIFSLTYLQLSLLVFAAFLIGFSKTGISAATMPVIPIVASIFGGKASTGIMLPMLLLGDVFALYYYKQHGEWSNIKKLLPWTLVGLFAGIIVGDYINDRQFKAFIAVSLFICLCILVYTEKKGDNLKVPNKLWFFSLMGIAAGFTSMIGNAAGPLFSVYLLALGFKKNNFMGTMTWFFFIINLTKLPMQIFFWHNITFKFTTLALCMIPAITAGALLGVVIIRKLNEKSFRYIIIVMTLIAAIRLLF